MTEFKFEGQVESLTQCQLQFLSGVLQKRGLKGNKVLIETLGKADDNFVSGVKKITTILDDGETLNIIAKLAPTNKLQRMGEGVAIMFGNECIMYDYVLPKFVSLQRDAGVPKEELYRFPECFGTLTEPMNEIILLEDLKESNFEMLDKFKPLTNESVRLVLKNFAILHSLSFVLKKQDPDTFDFYKEKLSEHFEHMFATPEFNDTYPILEKSMISILDDDKYRKACSGTVSKMAEHFAKIKEYDSTKKHSVVIHGDCWSNNFMFRLKDNVPVEAILVDYQLSGIASPACDLLFMTFVCTDYNTRHQYYHEWIDYYHSELDKSLSNFGINVNSVYSRDKLDADLRRHSKAYFATTLLFYSFIIKNPENAAKMKEVMENNTDMAEVATAMAVTNLDPESITLYKNKIKDLVDSYIEFGYCTN